MHQSPRNNHRHENHRLQPVIATRTTKLDNLDVFVVLAQTDGRSQVADEETSEEIAKCPSNLLLLIQSRAHDCLRPAIKNATLARPCAMVRHC